MRIFKGLILIFSVSLLMGCHLFAPVNLPPMQSYSLTNTHFVLAQSSVHSSKTILVNFPIADSGFDSNKMIYEKMPYSLESYADHEWVSPPSTMLLPLLAEGLRAQGYFKAVVAAPFLGASEYYLNTRLVTLKQSFLQPVSREELVLQETLVNALTGQVIASKQFSMIVSTPGNDAYAGVKAANTAAHALSQQIAVWVMTHVQG